MSYLLRWKREARTSLHSKLFLFIISPFIALLYSLKSLNTRSSFIIIFLFSICFGMAFSVTDVINDKQLDGVSYRVRFKDYCHTSAFEYYTGLEDFLSFDGRNKDYYYETVAFFVSRITENYHVMFFLFSVVFAFFQLRSLKYLVLNKDFRVSSVCMILVLLFAWNQIFNINGMRFWTAAWVGVYCMFKIFYEGKNKYFLLALTSPFFHGSFWLYLIVLLIAKLTAKFEKIWIVLFIFSIISSNILLEIVQGYNGFMPSFLEGSVYSYTDDFYVRDRFESTGTGFWWVDKLFGIISKIYINTIVVILILNRKKVELDNSSKSLFGLLLVWLTFSNFAMSIPSVGGRFVVLGYSLIAFLWLNFFKGKQYNIIIYLFPFAFFMAIYHQINLYAMVTNLFFYISSPFILIPQYLF